MNVSRTLFRVALLQKWHLLRNSTIVESSQGKEKAALVYSTDQMQSVAPPDLNQQDAKC